jgi:hypothetical protein
MVWRILSSLAVSLAVLFQASAADWHLEIVPTRVSADRNLIDTSFYVVLVNSSNSDLYIWREWCSWGYSSLSFTITTPDGRSFEVNKKGHFWTMNYPDPYLVRPGRYFVWNVQFSPDEWQGFPPDWTDGQVTIQAHFEQTKDESLPPGKEPPKLWLGKVSSDSLKVDLYKKTMKRSRDR